MFYRSLLAAVPNAHNASWQKPTRDGFVRFSVPSTSVSARRAVGCVRMNADNRIPLDDSRGY